MVLTHSPPVLQALDLRDMFKVNANVKNVCNVLAISNFPNGLLLTKQDAK